MYTIRKYMFSCGSTIQLQRHVTAHGSVEQHASSSWSGEMMKHVLDPRAVNVTRNWQAWRLNSLPSSPQAWRPSSVQWAAGSRWLEAARRSSSPWWRGRGWKASASCPGRSQTPEEGGDDTGSTQHSDPLTLWLCDAVWSTGRLTQRAVRGIPSLSLSSGSSMPSCTESSLLSSAIMGKGRALSPSLLKAITSCREKRGRVYFG